LGVSVKYRLAFREFGVSIGTNGLESLLRMMVKDNDDNTPNDIFDLILKVLEKAKPLEDIINESWDKETNRKIASWKDHNDINNVMWCCTKMSEGFLE